jgi:hypothetical protein
MVLRVLENHDFTWDPELEPMIYRMDTLDMELVGTDQTLLDIRARNKEIFLVSGMEKKGYNKDSVFLQLQFI